jgi:hypothetical protein
VRILNYSHLIALVLVTLFLFNQTSHSQLQQNISSVVWKTYTNVNQGYKIQYPSSWSLGAEDSAMGADVVSTVNIGLKEKVTGDKVTEVELRVQQFPEQVQTLEDLRNLRIVKLSEDGEITTKVINYSSATLSNRTAFKIFFERPEWKILEGVILPAREVLTITTFKPTSHEAFIISYFANPQLFTEYLPIVERMINSFQFTK